MEYQKMQTSGKRNRLRGFVLIGLVISLKNVINSVPLYDFQSTSGGSLVGAISGSTQRETLVVGKPSTSMIDYLAKQICMVGVRLDTDILFGQNGGRKTLLVLPGVTPLAMLQNPNNNIQPDFYTNKISDFLSLKAAPA
ncbi:phosphoglycolate phosphatase 1B, chloroplastic-like [Neltuma alba]|uniref:phosphoglycolate phosphatase 1B, chloroplastic-like n=1 Tax=Neltuma alba TaxID=207710 RepID=UPI0010A51516|nr:phosphoglycolate phosphatase 1B, chloroplastic-like [Prosopis alba]